MIFSSLLFLGIFLPAVLVLYNLSKNMTYKNIVLVVSSLIFYAWGEPVYVLALVFSSLVDYTVGFVIHNNRGTWKAKAALLASLTINLGLLGVFKYGGFFADNINFIFKTNIPFKGFALPLGISFYTFQTMSYSIDMYNGNVKLQRSLLKFMVYVSMFPQLVAGPIVRYIDIESQMDNRRVTMRDFEYGVMRFTQGLFKKVVLANGAGKIVAAMLDGDLTKATVFGSWFGIIMYSFQILYDFSGYSDMAIGLGRMFGFKFLENFNYPYMSRSVTEFWRRWHISLGTFFRDYVYIPLGGNRHNQLRNILVVWLLTGFWHGASWNFVLWGLYYGIILIIEKKCIGKLLARLPVFVRILYNYILVVIGWALFYFTDFSRLKQFFHAAFGMGGGLIDTVSKGEFMSNIFLLVLLVLCSAPIFKNIALCTRKKAPALYRAAAPIWVFAVMAICFTLLVGQTYNPFLYFRF